MPFQQFQVELEIQTAIVTVDFVVFDDGRGTGVLGTSRSQEMSPERTAVIIRQVRAAYHARDPISLTAALNAAYYYNPTYYVNLSRQYGDLRWTQEVTQ